ncbi:MAG: hypothetical protein Q8P41_28695 [Pseudomonadota bacterium]|nr:hypothetical protein [Pseudomonadota bacterium]
MRVPLLVLALGALALAPAAEAGSNKVRHTNVVPPAWTATAPSTVGQITDLEVAGGVVYVAGTTGIAALSPAGEAKWTVALPAASFRNIAADDKGVAFTSYSLAGIDPSEGFRFFVLGKLGDAPTYVDATVGSVTLDGALAWSTPSDVQSPHSAPGLSPTSIAVMRGKDMVVVDRADGHVLAKPDIKMMGEDSKFFSGFYARGYRVQPVFWEGQFYSAFYNTVIQVNPDGSARETAFGPLFRPFYNVTCGLVPFGKGLTGGSTGDTQKGNAYYAFNGKFGMLYNEWSPDKQSGCGSVTVVGERAVYASNFSVWAINSKGKTVWKSENRKGGLYPASGRGIGYVHYLGFRKSYPDLMVADPASVYIATSNDGDVITVLEMNKGKYVRTIDVKAPIVAMGLTDAGLVVATDTDVRFSAR